MKPGIYTTEFGLTAGTVAAILSGVVSSEHAQIISLCVAAGYTFFRTVLKAVETWKGGSK